MLKNVDNVSVAFYPEEINFLCELLNFGSGNSFRGFILPSK